MIMLLGCLQNSYCRLVYIILWHDSVQSKCYFCCIKTQASNSLGSKTAFHITIKSWWYDVMSTFFKLNFCVNVSSKVASVD